jgi:uncharacterized protein
MFLACAIVKMVIAESYSLKDRRRVMQGLTATIGKANHLAAADLSPDGTLNLGILGVTAISNTLHHASELRETALRGLDRDNRFEVVSIVTEEIKMESGESGF